MNSKKIFIVDDEALIRQLIGDKFTKDGHKVQVFANPLYALAKLEEDSSCDLIITDYKMPEMSGLDFVIAVNKKYPQIPIIVISGYGSNEDITNFLKHGAYDYLAKPFALKDLISATARLFTSADAPEVKPNYEHLCERELGEICFSMEKYLFDTRPKIIRSLKLIEEVLEENVSLPHKVKLQEAQAFCKEVSSKLVDATEFLRKITKT